MEDTRAPAEVATYATTIEVAGGGEEANAATPPPRFMREDEVAQNPPVALASYPRSGNSLLRVLLEKITGHITGSDTRPDRKLSRELLDYGLLGEGVVDLSQVWIVKTHFPERFGYKRYKVKKIILLVRNPFDTLDSYFNMVLTSSHTKSLDESEYERLQREWDQLVRREIQVWTKFYEYYLFVARSSGVPLKVVRYEDLMTRRWHTMRGLVCFLYDLKSLKGTVYDERIQALATHELTQSHQAYKPRKGKVDHSLAHFSEEQKTFILKLTRDVLCYFGYSKYLDLLRAPSPSPSAASVAGSEPDVPQKNESEGKSEDPERKEKRRTEKEEIVAYILKNYQDSRIYLTPGLLHVNFGLPLREVSPTDPFGRGMSWKKEVLARKPVALAQPTNEQ